MKCDEMNLFFCSVEMEQLLIFIFSRKQLIQNELFVAGVSIFIETTRQIFFLVFFFIIIIFVTIHLTSLLMCDIQSIHSSRLMRLQTEI